MESVDIGTFSLRPATPEDLGQIAEIEAQCYRAPCLPWTLEAFKGELEKPYSRLLVLTDDSTDELVAGYIVYWVQEGEAHILNVAVRTEWRGLGFGEKLVRVVLNEAVRMSLKRIFLEVRKSNDGAVKLYQKIGFHVRHIKSKFYENGEDAYFMEHLVESQGPAF